MATTLTAMSHQHEQKQRGGGIMCNQSAQDRASVNKHSKLNVKNNITTTTTTTNVNVNHKNIRANISGDCDIRVVNELQDCCNKNITNGGTLRENTNSSTSSSSSDNVVGRLVISLEDDVIKQQQQRQQTSSSVVTSSAGKSNINCANNNEITQARAPTPRMQGGIPLPVVPQPQQPTQQQQQQFNLASVNLQAQIAQAQQLLLARVVPQLLLPTQNYMSPTAAAAAAAAAAALSPYSYMLPPQQPQQQATFSPFHLLSAGGFLTTPQGTPSPNAAGGGGGILQTSLNSPQPFVDPAVTTNFDARRLVTTSSDFKNLMKHNSMTCSNNNLVSNNNNNNHVVPSTSAGSMMTSPHVNRSHSSTISPEEVEQHIAKLISENEALLQPSPVLLKRRSYTRQAHNSLDASTTTGGGIGQNFGRSLTTGRGMRSQSLVETLTSQKSSSILPLMPQLSTDNQHHHHHRQQHHYNHHSHNNNNHHHKNQNAAALNFHAQVQNATLEAMNKLYSCKFCKVGIRHLEELIRHEEKCGRREEEAANLLKLVCQQQRETSSTPTSTDKLTSNYRTKELVPIENNKHPLKKRILAAAELDAKCVQLQKIETTTTTATTVWFHQLPHPPTNAKWTVFRPYCGVSVKIQNPSANLEPVRVGRKSSQVTTPTFTTSVRELRPTHRVIVVDEKRSNYSTWSSKPNATTTIVDSKSIFLMLDGYVNRPKSVWIKYTTASRELNLMRVTHSTYWSLSKKLSALNNATTTTADVVNRTSTDTSTIATCSSQLSTSTTNSIDETTSCKDATSRCQKSNNNNNHVKLRRLNGCCWRDLKTKWNFERRLKRAKWRAKKLSGRLDNDDNEDDNEERKIKEEDDEEETEEKCFGDEIEIDVSPVQVWQFDKNSLDDLRQRHFAHRNIWDRIRSGRYYDRDNQTPPPPNATVIEADFNRNRSKTAPPNVVESTEENKPDFFPSISSKCLLEESSEICHSAKETDDDDDDEKKHLLVTVKTEGVTNGLSLQSTNFIGDGKVRCDICSKEFVKAGLLRLHMDVHRLVQSSRRNDLKCVFCSCGFRSRSLLQKHLSHAHPQRRTDDDADRKNTTIFTSPSTSSSSLINVPCCSTMISNLSAAGFVRQLSPTTTTTNNNPRPFECVDCNVAFRIHGHLAKHLRSKSHIMKLESLEKVPIGTFAKLEENSEYLTEIDTSDCRNSLKSLLSLGHRLMTTTATNELTSRSSYESPSKASIVSADLWVPPKSPPPMDVVVDNVQRINNKEEEKNNNESCRATSNSRCNLCNLDFLSSTELEIHWHADHVLMRDGNCFKCPKAGCDSVYPNKSSLRLHLSTHFYGRSDDGVSFDSGDDVISCNNKITTTPNKKLLVGCTNNKTRSKNHCLTKLFRESSSGSTDYSPVSESDSNPTSRSVTPNVDETNVGADEFLNSLKRKSSLDNSTMTPSAKLRVLSDADERRPTSVVQPQKPTVVQPTPEIIAADQPPMPFLHQRIGGGVWNPFNNCSPMSAQSMYLAAAASNPFALMNLNHHNVKLFGAGGNSYVGGHQWSPLNGPQLFPHRPHAHLTGGGMSSAFQRGIGVCQDLSTPATLSSVFLPDELRCIVCNKQCTTPMSLQEHVMSHNLESRLHVCKFCDAGFTTAQALNAHLPCRLDLKSNYSQTR